MRLERKTILAVAFTAALAGGCSQPDRSETAVPASESPAIAVDSQITDHLAAAAVWGDLVATGARSDTPTAPLAAAAAHMDEEISRALFLAREPGNEPRTVGNLEDARSHAMEAGKVLASPAPDRGALAQASEKASAAVQAAGEAHDSIIPDLSDPGHPFRMFALTWPHHELAVRYALLDADLTAIESARDPHWAETWTARLDPLERDLVDSRSAFRAFADKLDPILVKTYGHERRDDRFNAWTDEIRAKHDAIQKAISSLRVDLSQKTPDQAAALAALDSIRNDLDAAREDHRKLAQEIGEPYPDYEAAISEMMNQPTGQAGS
jgi:hypothetical protein